jgi:hypothetical protein
LGLRRPKLRENRLELLENLEARFESLSLAAEHPQIAELQAHANKARAYIVAAMLPDAKFSSMVIDYVAGHELNGLL